MQDQVVVFTGFRDKSLEDRIKVQGGTIGSGVSSKTTILVVKDKSFTSSKVDKAKSLGIKVFTSDELIKRFKL
jgi:NAD-dependent DNA ligase